jgi:large subunit ribosomal protein L20
MTRVKGGTVSKTRRRKVLKLAKGYFGSKHRLYKTAQEQLFHSGNYAFRDRKQNKRNFRKLWITRINAACREADISYSKFINGLAKANVSINRKMLSEMAVNDIESFNKLVTIAKSALDGKIVAASKEEETKTVKGEKAVTKKVETAKKVAPAKKDVAAKKVAAKKTTTTKKAVTKKAPAAKKTTTTKKETK